MGQLFQIFLEVKNELGWEIAIIFLLVVMLVIVIMKSFDIWFFKKVKWVVQGRMVKIDKKECLNHPLFLRIQLLKNHQLQHLVCRCPLRRKIFIDLLTVRLDRLEKVLKQLVEREGVDDMLPEQFCYILKEAVYDISEWHDDAIKKGIPQAAADRFAENIADIRETLVGIIGSPTNYSLYMSNYARLYNFLVLIDGFEEWIYSKLGTSLDNLNGDISGSTYAGVSCMHCEVCQSVHQAS